MAPSPNKRRRLDELSDRTQSSVARKDNIPWRSESRRRIYSAKLVEALFRARNAKIASPQGDSTDTSGWGGVLVEVRGIADRVLASAAKGRTRWSRAILANHVRVNALGKPRHRKVRQVISDAKGNRLRKGRRLDITAVDRKVKALGRLVPGCRGISVTSLLEEATDYMSALEMQVKSMTALSQLLRAPAVRSSSPTPAPVNDDVDDVTVSSVLK